MFDVVKVYGAEPDDCVRAEARMTPVPKLGVLVDVDIGPILVVVSKTLVYRNLNAIDRHINRWVGIWDGIGPLEGR